MLVAMVGNLRPWKGQHIAIEALAGMPASRRREIQLLIIGSSNAADAAYEQDLLARVESAGLKDQVRFLGHRTDVPDLMAASDVVLHASTEPEPFGLVVVEGMALGRPVVASSIGGPLEILDNKTGLMFSPARPDDLARHLSMLVAKPDRRRALGKAAQARAKKFGIANTVEETTRVYDQLMGRKAKPRR
jgi:glycosyltransferase involved in cell wall biosynthesis